jgi:hypothetical protein
MNFDEEPKDGEEPNDGNVFYYTGIEGEITWNVTVVRVKSRVRVIRDRAFDNCRGLRTIFFKERLDLFGVSAFRSCYLLQSIIIPLQYPAERYVGIQDCHIRNWQPACQPTIPSSDAEGNRELTCIYFSKESSTLAKVLKGLQADGHST